ncbi:MAG TPA: hypothetical protein VFJ76_07660 [Solirubrobacterales bacterium]|nr:hypothetical protein [Solirubrobacterales bacterium]
MTETAVAEKAETKPATVPRYTEAETQRALVEVAACSGNTHQAARHLAEDENAPSICQKTLWLWSRRTKVEQYESIRAKALPAITEQAAEQHMSLARKQMGIAEEAADIVKGRLARMEDKDLVNAMGKMDIGSGIHSEKARDLSGQSTPKGERTVEELLRGLAGKGIELGERVVEETEGKRVSVERVASVRGAVPAESSDSLS